jgi:hypothetical protein
MNISHEILSISLFFLALTFLRTTSGIECMKAIHGTTSYDTILGNGLTLKLEVSPVGNNKKTSF